VIKNTIEEGITRVEVWEERAYRGLPQSTKPNLGKKPPVFVWKYIIVF
jgi:hypothetical protein